MAPGTPTRTPFRMPAQNATERRRERPKKHLRTRPRRRPRQRPPKREKTPPRGARENARKDARKDVYQIVREGPLVVGLGIELVTASSHASCREHPRERKAPFRGSNVRVESIPTRVTASAQRAPANAHASARVCFTEDGAMSSSPRDHPTHGHLCGSSRTGALAQ